VSRHVTQRGNAGFLLAAESEKAVYLELLQKYLELYEGKLGDRRDVSLISTAHAEKSIRI